jgi:hypothetical protein
MNFSEALEALKSGMRVTRDGWNGKAMFIFLVPGSIFQVNRAPLMGIFAEGTEIQYQPHVDMCTAQGTIVPWLCSQTDLLAEDWTLRRVINDDHIKSKPLVIYHGGCADGFGAAYAVWKLSGDSCDYFPGVYQEDPPDVTGRQVFLVGFSYKRPVLEKMAETAACILVLDHHASTIADLAPYQRERGQPPSAGLNDKIEVVFDQSRSGAIISWEWFNPDTEVPDLLLYIQDRELGKFELPHSREISMALHSYPQDFAVWDALMDQIELLYHEGVAIKRWYDKVIQFPYGDIP